MDDDLRVIYNGACPICATEIAAYRRHAVARGLAVRFDDLNQSDLTGLGLSPDAAARRLYVVEDGTLHGGLDAFIRLWARLPKYRLLARIAAWPAVRPLAGWLYDHAAAPLLYALHKRRQRRSAP